MYDILKKNFPVVDCFDPIVDREIAKMNFGIRVIPKDELTSDYDLVVKMVNHRIFNKMDIFANTEFIELKDLL